MSGFDGFTFTAFIFYMILQLGISIWASRSIKSEVDYLLAGRHLGILLLSFSLFASWFGAETMVASSGAIAAEGLSGGRAEPFGYAICLVLFGVLLAVKLRERGYVTVSDFYRERFNVGIEKFSVLLMIPTSLIWAAAQALAFGHILTAVTGFELETALLIGTVLLIVYTTLGGFLGDVLTDLVQGIVIIVGLFVMLVFLVFKLGGPGEAFVQLSNADFSLINPDESLWLQMDEWMIAIVGSLAAQEAIARILAARNAQVAKTSCYAAAAMYFIIGMIPALIGLLGANLVTLGEDTDAFLPELAKTVLPPFLYVMFLGALTSAILSTIDTTVLSVAALIGHNVIAPLRPQMTEQQKIALQRGIVILGGVATYFIATAGENIYSLIEMSSSFGSSGLVVCMLFGLWSGWGGPYTAAVTLFSGAVAAYIYQYVYEFEAGYVTSLVVSAVVYGIVGYMEKNFVKTPLSTA